MSEEREPPRVTLLCASLDPGRGGQERSIREYALELVRLGAVVTIAAGRPAPLPGVEVVALRPHGRGMAGVLAAAEAAAAAARDTSVVHAMLPVPSAHFYMPRGGIHREAYLRSSEAHATGMGRRVSRLLHPLNAARRALLKAEKDILEKAAGPVLVALSRGVADAARRHHGLPEERIRVVSGGVGVGRHDPSEETRARVRADLGIPPDAVMFLALAHNHRLKGVPQLMRAAASLPAVRGFKVVILGGEPGPSSERVMRLGAREDAAPFLQAADVLVHPTFYDPCSRALLEGAAAGKPLIASSRDGAVDVVAPACLHILRDPRDVNDLARAMLLALDADRRARSAAAAGSLREAVSMKRHARRMLDLFRRSALSAP